MYLLQWLLNLLRYAGFDWLTNMEHIIYYQAGDSHYVEIPDSYFKMDRAWREATFYSFP